MRDRTATQEWAAFFDGDLNESPGFDTLISASLERTPAWAHVTVCRKTKLPG
jgi:hypothetical protein